ncbi:MAG: aldehyde dehydrogenase [Blastocatellia bacterium]|nr:aldehyde dehydrogenase [Blastocatellia bacterium]
MARSAKKISLNKKLRPAVDSQSLASAWSPLHNSVFRALWIATVISNIGTWMQDVGESWLMTSLTPSPVLVALVETFGSLPVVLLALPAGALADIVDRRRLLLVMQVWMFVSAGAMGVLALMGQMTPARLLSLTFLLGIGTAMSNPVWQAITPELVRPTDLSAAITLSGVGINIARAIGPALAGLIVAASGPCYLNNGQACIAASRQIVPQDRLDEVKRLTKAAVEQIKMGDPRNKDVSLGPLASVKQYKRVQEYINSGIEEGAELVIGGEGHPRGLESGNFVKPTVFANVTRDMRIAREEIFGPVLSILTYKTEAEAIEIANDTEFGLIAYVSSADPERANRVARKLAAGRVLINTIGHDPFAPFGGFKQSGIGREGGIFGLEEYLEPKAIIS